MPQIGKMIFFVKGDVIEKGFKHGQDTAQAGVRLLLSSNVVACQNRIRSASQIHS